MLFSSKNRYQRISKNFQRTSVYNSRIDSSVGFNFEIKHTSPKAILIESQPRKSSYFSIISQITFDTDSQTNMSTELKVSTKPVYVDIEDGKEILVYHRKKMLVDKLYEVTWLGNKIGLLKTKTQDVIMYEAITKK